MPLCTEVGLGPGHIVLYGDPSPLERGTAPRPTFRSMFIVAKWLDGSRRHLVRRETSAYCGQTVAHLSYCWPHVSKNAKFSKKCSKKIPSLAISGRHNSETIIDRRKFTNYGMSSFYFYRWNQLSHSRGLYTWHTERRSILHNLLYDVH